MKNPRLTVFAGAILSLAIMHVMASFFGYATTVIPRGRSLKRFEKSSKIVNHTLISFDLLHFLIVVRNIWHKNALRGIPHVRQ